MKIRFFILLYCMIFGVITPSVEAAYKIQDGWFVNADQVATMPAQDHFEVGLQAIEACDWPIAAMQFNIVALNFPSTPYGKEAYFYLGIAYFQLEEYDFANDAFSDYLKVQSNPTYFQETVEYKFCIAKMLAQGAKCRVFGTKKLPKWACGQSLALEIYDEVIATVPCHEIAAKALVSKAHLQWRQKDYRGAVESFQQVIRRFPKHELAPECYLLISRVYLQQSYSEFQNPDILAFAMINLRKFQRDFPREERLCEVEMHVNEIKEIYAEGLYDMGQFYERTRKRKAAIIYYYNAIHQFPDTCVAMNCRARLACIDPDYCESSEPQAVEMQDQSGCETMMEDIDFDN